MLKKVDESESALDLQGKWGDQESSPLDIAMSDESFDDGAERIAFERILKKIRAEKPDLKLDDAVQEGFNAGLFSMKPNGALMVTDAGFRSIRRKK